MTGTLMVGVSGIRGIVDKDLTPSIVERYARAFGLWARERTPRVVVGRDSRQSGPAFARACIAGLGDAGCEVIDIGVVPTPTVQLAVTYHHAGGGIAITASHNPIQWNALKFLGPDSIFLDGEDGRRVLEMVDSGRGKGEGGRVGAGSGKREAGSVKADPDAVARHLDAVLRLPVLNVDRIRARRFHVALDAVRGAGGPVMQNLFERLGCRVTGINLETTGEFPRAPEPVPENLTELAALVQQTRADVGIAVDPDVDRLAIVDETGKPIGEDYTLAFAVRAVLADAAVRPSGRPAVVVNLSTSLVVEDAARDCGASLVRTLVGEAHVARKIVELGAPIGGEGNGGVMYPPLHVGRDAPVAGAFVLELLARSGRRVSELVAASPRYAIVKAKVDRGAPLERVYAQLKKAYPRADVDEQDGLRLGWRDRWLHVRPSNTEPIIRLIAEGPSPDSAQHLVEQGRRLCLASE